MRKQDVIDALDSITKEENTSEHISNLQQRVKRCVCRYCGNELVLRRISYGNAEEGRIDIFCPTCNRIEYGVEPEIYQIAKYYIDEIGFDYYYDLDKSVRKDRMNMAKVCEMMQWCCKNLGLLDAHGFCEKIKLDGVIQGKDMLISEKFLKSQLIGQ